MSQLEFANILGGSGGHPRGVEKIIHQPIQGFPLAVLFEIFRSAGATVDRRHHDKAIYLWTMAPFLSLFALRERQLYNQIIHSTELVAPPIFVLGHWRSGTTLLHNFLGQDPNHTYPRAYQSFTPGFFLLPRLKFFLNRIERHIDLDQRPMDNVRFSFAEPWEDEFLMLSLTGISPYKRALFPRWLGPESQYRYPDFRTEEEIIRWKKTFQRLMKRLTVLDNKRLVLKSPPHMGRINTLLDLYPEAKFIHIVRDPYAVFASNLRVWRDGLSLSFLQDVTEAQLLEIVFSTYEQLFDLFFRTRWQIPEGHLVEVCFEDLVHNPMQTLAMIYKQLQLPGFDEAAHHMKSHLAGLGGYERNIFRLPRHMREIIHGRWHRVFETYGYSG